jgi:hypothetical protein
MSIEGITFTLNKIFVMAWIVKLYQVFPPFLMHSSYCYFFNTFSHSIIGVKPTIFTLYTRCTNLDVTCAFSIGLYAHKEKKKHLMVDGCRVTKNHIEGRRNAFTHSLHPLWIENTTTIHVTSST